ncbi:uncharacterized protein LOC108890967 isoform X2 [Lates calcarifer]|uniref:Uncharacterized protein LOC108890967 isoform X2 n=1 Tax=Lates calcarifer TaxID=8187 RepID=A0AAJ8B8Q4_LATCA|nr:uncharacterized protein LOC108890967 isoform X2 [Lates calcarifer]
MDDSTRICYSPAPSLKSTHRPSPAIPHLLFSNGLPILQMTFQGPNLNLWSRVLSKQKICHGWADRVYIAHQISRGLVCLNSALNPLVYLQVNEEIPAQLRQLLHRARQMLDCLFLSNSGSVTVEQNADEVYVPM